ncbi:hypothetical protein VTK73DRAFT_4170 [Phialemonium thermophilum]|uniref:Large ribosomal subunit protein mL46 n=1 Tax=Phialemonium thermophilum TaxID=223376 RepID=A0ABR3XZF2_9PEZI
MAAASRGGRVISTFLRDPSRTCSWCANSNQWRSQRFYSSNPTSPSIQPPTPGVSDPSADILSPPVTQQTREPYRIKSGIILTRPPLLTRELTPFESAFFLYQKRLNERLAAPFRKAFYFRPDTPAALDWQLKRRERRGVAARDIGRYNPRGRTGWDDEVLVGSPLSDPAVVVERLVQDAELRVSEDGEEIPEEDRVKVERPLPRRTEADEKGDTRRLDRLLDRTLYLVVRKGEKDPWQFPSGDVLTSEALHETAARILAESAGVNMNTWIVGRVPVAHVITDPVYKPDSTLQKRGEKTFFLKGRIMAGQADLADNAHGLTDFQWLSREELQELLPGAYFRGVRNMMADR